MPPLPDLEKSPLSSKKFIAYLLAEASWKIILLATLWSGKDVLLARDDIQSTPWMWWFMFTIVIVAGFIEVGFIGGQAWLDKYVRVAKITAGTRPGAPADKDESE